MGVEELAVSIAEEKMNAAAGRGRSLEAADPQGAAQAYDEAARYAEKIAGLVKGGYNQSQAKERARRYRQHAQALRNPVPAPRAPDRPGAETAGGGRDADKHLALAESFVAKVEQTWDDIAGLDETKRVLKGMVGTAVAKPPPGVRIEPATGILLYGPPGTGKTMLAAAACGAFGATFLNVPASKLKDKYVGESGKILQSVFELARQRAPSLIFFDDIDTVVTNREGGETSGVSRDIIGGLLTAMDGLASKGKGPKPLLLVLANTNQPWILDEALLSRFTQKVYVPLPDLPTRRKVLGKLLTDKGFVYQGSLDDLAKRTEGFSGRELNSLCKTLGARMLTEANRDLVEKDLTVDQMKAYTMRVAPITEADAEEGLARVRPMTSPETVARMEAWGRE